MGGAPFVVQRRQMLKTALLAPVLTRASPHSAVSTGESVVWTGSLPPYRSLSTKTPDGVSIAIQVWGNPRGAALVLIHGLNQCRLSWLRQLDSELTERYQIVTYDLRGHGDSDKPTEPRYYAEGARWADELAMVIEAAGVHRPALVGWSLGGVVLTSYLARHGHEQIAAINFVDAWTADNASLYTAESEVLAESLLSSDLVTRLHGIRAFLSACFHTPPPRDLFELMLSFNSMPPVAVQKGISAVTFDGADAALRALRIPVVVTHGAHDRLFPVGMSRYTAAAVPGSQLSIYANSGHSPFMEDSRRFNRELKALLERAFG